MSNDEKLIRSFLNEFSIISENKNELYSMLIPLILAKQFFKRSSELKAFVETVLVINDIKDYAYNSRSVLLGRIMKHISLLSIEEAVELNKRVSDSLLEIINTNKSEDIDKRDKTDKPKKQNISFFSKWYNYLENMD
jgi:hypothetical protein